MVLPSEIKEDRKLIHTAMIAPGSLLLNFIIAAQYTVQYLLISTRQMLASDMQPPVTP